MIDTAEVFLWGTRIGYIHQSDGEAAASFEYDKSFQNSGIEVSPFKMPLSNRVFAFPELAKSEAFKGLPGLLSDSLPDKFGNAVIDSWLISQGRDPGSFTSIERLCYTGKRGMGALEYLPSTYKNITANTSVDVTEMIKLASEILSKKESMFLTEKEADIASLVEIGSSAGGARAKAVIAWNESTGEIKSVQLDAGKGFDYWLIKFDGVSGNGDHNVIDKKQYSLIEYAYYLMALDLDINMSECRIYEKDGLHHFMTKRFDRVGGKKIHVQTLGALCHIDYNIPGLCSYEMYADYAKKLGLTKKSIEQIYKRMVFGVLGYNCDDHVKNFSFLMDRTGKWILSPAYDQTFAYSPGNRWISKHQMTINGKAMDIGTDDLLICGKNMGLSSAFCKEIIAKTQTVISNWPMYAEKAGISEERAAEIKSTINKKR